MWAVILAVAILPSVEPVQDRVETIELNIVYCDKGNETLRQWVFWGYDGNVRDWRLVKGQQVYRDFEHGDYYLRWMDGDIWREVRAARYDRWDSQYDREIHERERLEKDRRRPLLHGSNP